MAALWERLSLSKKHTQDADAVSSAGSSTTEAFWKPSVDSGHGSPVPPSSLKLAAARGELAEGTDLEQGRK
jgi:hypothetical protein